MFNQAEMPARLVAFFCEREPGVSQVEVHTYEAMTGGYSRLLARADVSWKRGDVIERQWFVLRGDPPIDKQLIVTDRGVEYDVLRAVEHAVPVSRARHLDATGEHLGTPALVLDFVDAQSLLPYMAARTESENAALAGPLAEALAAYHTIPLSQLPASLERPSSWSDYIGRRINEWRRTADAHAEQLPIMRYVAAWLDAHRPAEVPLALVHGDFQSANLMRRADGTLVVLDWELAQIGDPREDLGYFKAVAQAAPPDITELGSDEFCRRYRELTGLTEAQVNPAVIAYFLILGVIGTVRRLTEGLAGYADGSNRNLVSLFSGNSVMFGQMMWMQVSEQLEAAFTAAKDM